MNSCSIVGACSLTMRGASCWALRLVGTAGEDKQRDPPHSTNRRDYSAGGGGCHLSWGDGVVCRCVGASVRQSLSQTVPMDSGPRSDGYLTTVMPRARVATQLNDPSTTKNGTSSHPIAVQ